MLFTECEIKSFSNLGDTIVPMERDNSCIMVFIEGRKSKFGSVLKDLHEYFER